MDLAELSDDALLGKVEALAETERFSLIDLLIHLGELDQRTTCQNLGYASVFAFLTRRLGYSECDAMRRIRTARAARKYPSILRMLARGELHLVSVSLLAPLLTSDNHECLLRKASRRSTREVERLVAELSPAAAHPRDRIRPLPPTAPASISMEASNTPPAEHLPGLELAPPTEPVTPSGDNMLQHPGEKRVVFTFSAEEQVQIWFERARDLLRHRFPMGRMEEVIGEALKHLVEDNIPRKPSRRRKTATISPRSRHVPQWVKNEVWRRDENRCSYIGPDGIRCDETAWLEWDHIIPWALGGRSDDPANIRLLCRAHNQSQARRLGLWKRRKTG